MGPIGVTVAFHEVLPDTADVTRVITQIHVVLACRPMVGEIIHPLLMDQNWPRTVSRVNRVYEVEHIPACGSYQPSIVVHVIPVSIG